MSTKYIVIVEKYAERHFIKTFEKKYRRSWDVTYEALIRQLQSFEVLIERNIAAYICGGEESIYKVEFNIAGQNQSRHGSGNRCIAAVHKTSTQVRLLLVYHKTDLGDGNETTKWKQIIKDNYLEYSKII